MRELWEPRTNYRRLDLESWVNIQNAIDYPEIFLPYTRKYKNLTDEELRLLIIDARRNHWAILDLRECGLEYLPEELGNMPDLRILAIGNTCTMAHNSKGEKNTFTVLPESLGRLEKLIGLNLSKSHIHNLPSSIGNLVNLQALKLCYCHLKEIPYSIVSLGLPFEIELEYKPNCINLTGVKLDNGDITLFEQQHEIIEAYYRGKQAHSLRECKVIFLGDGGTGKSSLIQRIVNGTYDKKNLPTNGVNMTKWKTPVGESNYTLRILDFGGQEIMFTMHRCFLTAHTVYVVVCESRDDVEIDASAARWLETVNSFAPGCPVILVLNKADLNANVSVNERDLKIRNPTLKCVLKTSAAVNPRHRFGVNSLVESVCAEIPSAVHDYKMNADMLAVKQDLENMTEDYISAEDYREICMEHNIKDEKLQYGLLGYFRDLGVAYYYESDAFDTRLESVRVLNPEWLTNGIYRLILRTEEKGFLRHKEIKDTLRISYAGDVHEDITYTPEETEFVLHVMRFFQISHDMGNAVEMIPMKMPKTPPDTVDDFNKDNALHLRWEGTFLPNNLIHRLLIRKFPELDTNCVWRTGGKFTQMSGNCEALAEMNDKALDLYVYGTDARTYMDSFREEILRILSELNITAKEYVFCRSQDSGKLGKILYRTLKALYDLKIENHFVDDIGFISPQSVMDGNYLIRTAGNRDFFISYNNGRDKDRTKWIADVLRKNGYSVYFQGTDCTPGKNFAHWMAEALKHSNGFLAVWSIAYEQSKYCSDELNAAYVRQKKFEKDGKPYPLLILRVEDVPVGNPLFAPIVQVDLLSGDEETDRATLLDSVRKLRRSSF